MVRTYVYLALLAFAFVLLFWGPASAHAQLGCDPDFIGPLLPDDECFDEGFDDPRDPPIDPQICEDFRNDDGVREGSAGMGLTETDACWDAMDNLQGVCFNSLCAGCTDAVCRCVCLEPPALVSGRIAGVCNASGGLCPYIPEQCSAR